IRKEARFTGIENAPLPWLVSSGRALLLRSNVRFLFGSYFEHSLEKYDVVFCYLSPAAMPAIWLKAKKEMKPGTLLLSYEFLIPNEIPDICLNVEQDKPQLYGWRI
ncbi:MAG: class I SAM-dependent methyltransferase, partial [Undibacterium sp.]|nr:class I SAM-dependent methyltransferase [Undibacterium sp.]